MTDFETHPVGTADLVKRLREIGKLSFGWTADQAADRIEQLVATVEQLEATLARANAATAAACEVAALVALRMFNGFPNKITDEIRALATPDQTAALDKLIADAVKPYVDAMRYYETQFCEGFCEDMPDRSVTNEGMENDCGGCKARAILAASKKGGV